MRALASMAAAYLLCSGVSFAQPPGGPADAAPGREPDAGPGAAAGEFYAPGFGFRLRFVPPGISPREIDGFPGAAEPAYAPFDRFGRPGGLGLRLLDFVAVNGIDPAEDDTPGQFARRGHLGPIAADPDRSPYRAIGGVSGEWRYPWNSTGQFSLSAQHSQVRYLRDALRSHDGSLSLAGAGWYQAVGAERRSYLYAGIFGGQDRSTDNRADGGRTIGGLRISALWGAGERTDMFAYAIAASGRHDRPNASYALQRRDVQYDAGIGLNWRFAANWSVRPQFTFTRNDSNIELYDYNRYDLSVTLRRDFR